jgi:hypothetical protein
MALIDLKTDLTSLKFGKDRPGGGSSNQPYIEKPLNIDLPPTLDFLGNDFLLRGGPVGAPLATANDIARLTKYFTDFKNPSGLLFVAKQNLLSRTAVKTQTSGDLNEGIYTPLSTLAQVGVSAFGLHLNKQGLNPFDGVDSLRTYTDVINPELGEVFSIKSIDKNRLIQLYGTKFLTSPNSPPNSRFLGMNDISADPQILISYSGGPGSNLGVGKTNIRLTNPTLKINYATDIIDPTVNYLTLGYIGLNSDITSPTDVFGNLNEIELSTEGLQLDNPRRIKGYVPALYQKDFRSGLRQAIQSKAQSQTTLMSLAPSYEIKDNQTIENRVGLGDPGNSTNKNVFSYVEGANANDSFIPYGAASPNSYDKITVLPIYSSATINPNDVGGNDLVKFRIGVINNNDPSQKTYIHFRAFLDQISDQYTSDWDPTQYIGRGEKFYTYKGFDRKVSLSWTVAAQSKAELIPMYRKLNYLASVCAPDYSGNGYMRGNIVTLTIGGYFYEQPGIITGFSYEMNEDNATWEIGITDDTIAQSDSSVKELPHLIKVTGFNFIPIHKFVPRLQQNKYDIISPEIGLGSRDGNTYGEEKYIALSAGSKDNYDLNLDGTNKIVLFNDPNPIDQLLT